MVPGARPQTVQAFQSVLMAIAAPITAQPASSRPPSSDFSSRRGHAGIVPVVSVIPDMSVLMAGLASTLAQPAASRPPSSGFSDRRGHAGTIPVVSAIPDMVCLPGGRFLMGSPDSEAGRRDNEDPQHWVQVPPFEIGRYPITFAQWDACVAAGGCMHKPDDEGWGRGQRPVINVSWEDAQEYVRWLCRETGERWRLPTEAEWEYAARAGTTTPFSTGACITTHQANYDGNYDYNNCGAKTGVLLGQTQSVGSYPPNPWGLYDMHGNVWEWVEDCWHDSYLGAPADGSAWTKNCFWAREYRVLRGGAWLYVPRYLRSAYRGRNDPGNRYYGNGFRVARTLFF